MPAKKATTKKTATKAATKKKAASKRKKATKKKRSRLDNPPPTRNRGATGRPSKLYDQEVRDKILEAMKLGLADQDAAAYAGIDYTTFYRWQKAAEEDETGESAEAEFCKMVKREQAVGLVAIHRRVLEGESGWQGSAWLAERRFPDRYARQDRIQHTVETPKHFAAVSVKVQDMSSTKEGGNGQ